MQKRLAIKIDAELHRKAKSAAYADSGTLTKLVTELLENYLVNKKTEKETGGKNGVKF